MSASVLGTAFGVRLADTEGRQYQHADNALSIPFQRFYHTVPTPLPRVIPALTDTLPRDTLPKDSLPMRVYQLKEFNVRHRNLSEDSALLKKLKTPPLLLFLPLEDQKGILYQKDGRTHHLPGVSLNANAVASALDFKKKARDRAFRRRLEEKLQDRAVDKMYHAALVGRFIPLKGDSLYDFIDKTRPGAAFLSGGITAYDIGVYVKRRYKEYLDTLDNSAGK